MLQEIIAGQPFVIAILVIAITVLSAVIRYLYKENKVKDTIISGLNDKLGAMQDKRYEDLKQFIDDYKDPIAEISKQQKGMYDLFVSSIKQGK